MPIVIEKIYFFYERFILFVYKNFGQLNILQGLDEEFTKIVFLLSY